jgi:hypothetical protein
LQLIKYLLLFCPLSLFGQKDTSSNVRADFLFHYYEQGGDHSAVTGGTGTQELTDRSGNIILYTQLDSQRLFTTDVAFNYYSSASTDRIDSRMSSASSRDGHFKMNLAMSKKNKNKTVGTQFYSAIESDYVSLGLGTSIGIDTKNSNELKIGLKGYYDTWILIYPEELREMDVRRAPTDKRRSLNLSTSYSWTVNKNMNAQILADLTYQNGMLATPFHRVYFRSSNLPGIEQLPENRLKLPLGIKSNLFLFDPLILKGEYRYYVDNFGITAHTIQVKPVILVSNSITISPIFRYHNQSESKYFYKYKEASESSKYYSSDYDLAGLQSYKFSLELEYRPLYGVLGNDLMGWKGVSFRYSDYRRSDGLEAQIFGVNFEFVW